MDRKRGLIFNTRCGATPLLEQTRWRYPETGAKIQAMRDPTRGGLASTLNEFAKMSNLGIVIERGQTSIREEVTEAC